MGMTVFWTRFAENKLADIFDYYKTVASLNVARKMVSGIVEHSISLKNDPLIGQTEEALSNRPQGFRYLVYRHYKIIYWVNKLDNRIEVSNVFDCRQNPTKMKTEP
ncbi:MAG: type II toxin-antitoxin system RelE/ParE family toxin [Flavobacteriales bacterium]|nr:type II toxin-antitoxin system RelE/ParE family toxin [Flavobacteriales bacterium]